MRHMASACSSRKRWKGGRLTLLQRRAELAREVGRRAVGVAVLLAQRGEDGREVRGAVGLQPRERAARVVEAELRAGVDVVGGADALADREARLVDQLRDDAAEHAAGRVADAGGVQPARGEE